MGVSLIHRKFYANNVCWGVKLEHIICSDFTVMMVEMIGF